MNFPTQYRGLLSAIIVLTTFGFIFAHFFIIGKPEHEHWWVEYGLLIFSAYIVTAYIHNWNMYLRGTVITSSAEDKNSRTAILLVGFGLYGLVLYKLFLK